MALSNLTAYNLILGSASARRQQLLKELNLKFDIVILPVDEVYPKALKAHEITDYLTLLKTTPFLNQLKENDLLITSDTIVWHQNKALGKPQNYKEAYAMLQELSGQTHQVITSVCIKGKHIQKIFNDTTSVTFKTLSHDEIDFYIRNYAPFDKAGSYGIQDWIGKIGVIGIEGSYYNVMGLPVHKLYKELMTL